MTPRWATFGAFFLNGAMIGTWVGQIPFVQDRLDVSKATIGLALLCMASGAMVAMPLTGQILDRRSSATITRIAALVYLPLLALPLFAPTPAWLCLGLIVFGAANGSMDVAMNAHGVAVERALGRPIMSSLHAGWSFGGLAGSGGVALAIALGIDPRIEGVIASAALWLMAVGITARLGSASAHPSTVRAGSRSSRGVLLIGALCFLVMVTEGAMGDWSGIYLKNDLGAGASAAATGFAGFSLGMALARLAGTDRAPLGRRTPAVGRDGPRHRGAGGGAADRRACSRGRRVRADRGRDRERRAAAVQRSRTRTAVRPRSPPSSRSATRASSSARP